MEAMECILTRRSVRKYQNSKVENEPVQKILEAAMFAPSARNLRPWSFVVVDDRNILNKIAGAHPYSEMMYEAPLAVVVCADEEIQGNQGYWVQDCSAAIQNMLLAAHSLQLGSVWLGVYPREERIKAISEILELPQNIKPLGIVALGYPAEKPVQPRRYDTLKIHRNRW
ncbi:nitroreductase family protein [candidate division WOR-3 bacterium]|nr:nitroreductase family protein [candidate division WOR-3 bacterium]